MFSQITTERLLLRRQKSTVHTTMIEKISLIFIVAVHIVQTGYFKFFVFWIISEGKVNAEEIHCIQIDLLKRQFLKSYVIFD